jgi:hypothetical protein
VSLLESSTRDPVWKEARSAQAFDLHVVEVQPYLDIFYHAVVPKVSSRAYLGCRECIRDNVQDGSLLGIGDRQ